METSLGRLTLSTLVALLLVSFLSSISMAENINATQDGSVVRLDDNTYTDLWVNNSLQKNAYGCYDFNNGAAPDEFYRAYFEFRLNESANFNKVLTSAIINLTGHFGAKSVDYINTTLLHRRQMPDSTVTVTMFISQEFNATGTENLTYDTKPDDVISSPVTSFSNFTGFKHEAEITNLSYIFNDFYGENSLYLGIRSTRDNDAGGTCTSANEERSGYESYLNPASQPTLHLTFADVSTDAETIQMDGTKLVYFDFESGVNQLGSSFSEADFVYAGSTNTITPLDGTTIRNTAFNTAPTSTYIDENIGECFRPDLTGTFNYTANQRTEINVPTNSDVYCFNLSNDHNDRRFFGMIQVVHVNDTIFSINYGLAGSDYTTITNVFHLPVSPLDGQDVTVYWTSSQDVNSSLFYRYRDAGNTSFNPFSELFTPVTSQNHSRIIDGVNIVDNRFYQYYVTAGDTTDDNSGLYYNFSLGLGGLPPYTGSCVIDGDCEYIDNISTGCGIDRTCFMDLDESGMKLMMALLILIVTTIGAIYVGNFILGMGTFATSTVLLVTIGLLPGWLMTPIIILVGLIVANWIRKAFSD